MSLEAAPFTGRATRARWRPLLPSACLAMAWVVLFALTQRPARSSTSSPGPAWVEWASMLLAVLAAWVAPGLAAWQLLGRRAGGLAAAAFSLGLGLTFLLANAAPILLLRGNVRALAVLVCCTSATLVVAHGVAAWRRGRPGHAVPAPPAARVPAGVMLIAAVTAVVLLVPALGRGFTFGGDEWFQLRVVRHFMEAPVVLSATELRDFDAWGLVLALLVRLAGVELLDAYLKLLVPVLLATALLGHLALARTVLRRWSAVALACGLLALHALSDMQARGEGAGMALLGRLPEEKYVSLAVLLPLAQAALLGVLRAPRWRTVTLLGALGAGAVVAHPMAALWIGLPACGAALGTRTWRRRAATRWTLALGGVAACLVALAWGLRALRPPEYFKLSAAEWALNARLLELSHRQLLILSDDGWFMAHAALIAHPLMVGALMAAVALLPRWRRSLGARFLVSAAVLPVAIAYNPLAAPAVGAWITPWMVPRLLWGVPVALLLAAALHDPLARLESRLARRRRATPSLAAVLCALATTAVLLAPRMEASLAALRQRNRVHVGPGERDLVRFLAGRTDVAGIVLAPPGLSVRLAAWSSRLGGCPGPDAGRSPLDFDGRLEDCARLLRASRIGEAQVEMLRRQRVDYVLARADSPLDHALLRAPAFEPLYRGPQYAFYAWRAGARAAPLP